MLRGLPRRRRGSSSCCQAPCTVTPTNTEFEASARTGRTRDPPAASPNQVQLMQSARKTLSRPADLVAARLVSRKRLAAIAEVSKQYALALTTDVAQLIDASDAADPIARQFVPDTRELDAKPQESSDPIGDGAHGPIAGIVHRYPDRVLLTPLFVCAVYCRFCFRRETVGRQRALSRDELAAAIAYIRDHQAVWEVILTGGDPLVL